MPVSGVPLGPAEMSTRAGSFFGSTVYVPSAPLAAPGRDRTDFPSAENVQVVPAGGSSRLPPATALATAHAPTRLGGSFGGSLGPGAPRARARVRADVYMAGSRADF